MRSGLRMRRAGEILKESTKLLLQIVVLRGETPDAPKGGGKWSVSGQFAYRLIRTVGQQHSFLSVRTLEGFRESAETRLTAPQIENSHHAVGGRTKYKEGTNGVA